MGDWVFCKVVLEVTRESGVREESVLFEGCIVAVKDLREKTIESRFLVTIGE